MQREHGEHRRELAKAWLRMHGASGILEYGSRVVRQAGFSTMGGALQGKQATQQWVGSYKTSKLLDSESNATRQASYSTVSRELQEKQATRQ